MNEPKAEPISVLQSFFFIAIIGLIGVVVALAIPNFTHSGTSPKNTCINNLRLLDGAKQQWALEHGKTGSETPTWDDIKSYTGRAGSNGLLKCPSGGIYTLGALDKLPTCSIPGHSLPR